MEIAACIAQQEVGTLMKAEDDDPQGELIPKVESRRKSCSAAAATRTCIWSGEEYGTSSIAQSERENGDNLSDSSLQVASTESRVVSVWRRAVAPMRTKLLVLDMNGLLVATYRPKEQRPGAIASCKLGRLYVYKRPFCDQFLDFCLLNFHVGIWSSAKDQKVRELVEIVLNDMRHRLAFIWHQTNCTDTGMRHPDNRHKPVFLKELSRLWAEWKPGDYNPSNTLLVDDSPYKALRNPPFTAIFPRTYTATDADDNFLGVSLRTYLEGLRDAASVQEYVKNNPIGEPAITMSSPVWWVYSRIVPRDMTSDLLSGMKKLATRDKHEQESGQRRPRQRNGFIRGHRGQKIPCQTPM